MNTRTVISPFVVVGAIVLGLCRPTQADAVTVRGVPLSTYQIGFTAGVRHGLTVLASTNLNKLTAGGSLSVRCVSPNTGTIEAQRTLSSSELSGGNRLTVTIPEWVPATRDLPGFENVPGGTELSCGMYWTASAEEGTYTVNFLGIGYTVWGEKQGDGNFVSFTMYQPGGGGERNNGGCMH